MKSFEELLQINSDTYEPTKKDVDYLYEDDNIYTFDIETSSCFVEDGKIIPYSPGHTEEYWNSLETFAFCYKWMFGYKGEVYSGRKIEDFLRILDKFDKDTHSIIYVHNLAYDFQFLRNILTIDEARVFARDTRKMIYFYSKEYPNIEFRCSLFLTRKKLESWGLEVGIPKLVGKLDYTKIRTPFTHLTKEEEDYCEHDILIMNKGLEKYREKYGHVERIPLTQTGEVRRIVKKRVMRNKKLYYNLIKMIPRDAFMYHKIKMASCGGFTHANFIHVKKVKKNGYAYDIASSYPTVMCAEKYPCTQFYPSQFDETKTEKYAYIMRVLLYNVEAKKNNHYISYSKCNIMEDKQFRTGEKGTHYIPKKVTTPKGKEVEIPLDNGRVVACEACELWINEIDFQILKEGYDFDYHIAECYRAAKDYLPMEIIISVLEAYKNKTILKDKKGETDDLTKMYEDLYQNAKQLVNGIFGMMYMDLIQDIITFGEEGWGKDERTVDYVNETLQKLRFDNKHTTFLNYAWGGWITAYARRALFELMWGKNLQTGEQLGDDCDYDTIYCDTDSLKLCKNHDFSWHDKLVTEKLETMCEHYHIDKEFLRPSDPNGEKHPLGYFEHEEKNDFTEFVTLGAKRYCYRSKKDKKLYLTVAGINKEAVLMLKDDIRNFDDGFVFNKDSLDENGEVILDEEGLPCVKKQMLFYNENQREITMDDGYEMKYKYGISMRPTGYSMDIIQSFLDILTSGTFDFLRVI